MKKILPLICLILLPLFAFSQTYDECVKDFQNNNYTDAVSGLEQLQKAGNNKDASLLLAIIKANQEQYAAAFAAFKKFYEQADNPYPYLYALFHSGIFNNYRGDDMQDFLQKVIADPKADMAVKQIATDQLAAYATREGDFDAVRDLYKATGDVKNWATVGAFENISGSGFNKDYGVVAHPESNYSFTNKIGVPVKWFDIVAVRNDRWYDFEYHYNIENTIAYAQTFITSTEDKEVLMKIGVSGSLKVWLNDFLIGSESEERNTNSDVYIYKVKIQKGVNRLLVQLGSSEINRNNFMVRFFDLNNRLLPDMPSGSNYQPYTKAAPYAIIRYPFFAEKYFEDKLSANNNDFISQLLLLNTYDKNENRFYAHKILKDLKKAAPVCTYVSEQSMMLANIDKNPIEYSKEKESILSNDKESTYGLRLKFDEEMNKEKWDDAIAIIDDYTKRYGKSANMEAKFISVLLKKKDNEKATKEIDEAYNKYPDTYEIAMYKYYLISSGSKDLSKANEILNKYVKTNYSGTVIEQIIENDFKLGEKEQGIKWYNKLISNTPVAVGYYAKFANALYGMHNYDEAIKMTDKAIALAPYIGQYYAAKGEIYAAKNDKNSAIDMLQKAILYTPTNYNARKMLNRLQGKKELTEYFKENNITALYADARENKAYDKEDAVCILNDKMQVVYPEHGAVVEQNELLYIIKSPGAIEHFKEYNIQYNPYTQRLIIDKAEVLKKDGSKVAAERQKGNCVFSSIEVGDAIHLSYKLEASYQGKLAEHFWENFYFNSIYPVQISRFSLIVPIDKKFNFETVNTEITLSENTIDNFRFYTWQEKNVPKVVPEPAMSGDQMQELIISSIPDWNYVANWYSDVSNEKTQADFEVKEKVQELLAGNENKTDLQKAKIIYNYIEENYHYSSVPFLHSAFTPQRASRTLNTKLGDCKDLSTLFVSMAREAGLDANLVLVSTKDNSKNEFRLPTIAFNHCIAQLHADKKDYYVELTNKYLPFSSMFLTILNANGLPIPKDGKTADNTAITLLNTSSRPVNTSNRNSEVSIINDHGTIHRHTLKIGAESAAARMHYLELNDEERSKTLNADISKEFNKNVTLDSAAFYNLDKLNDTVALDYHFTVDNFITTIAGMKVFKMPWTESYPFAQLFSLEKRKYPMEMWYFASSPYSKETVTINIPSGKKLLEIPQNLSLSCAAFNYSVNYTVSGNKLIATREFTYLGDEIKPEEYAGVKATVSQILESDAKEFAFK